MPPMSETYRNIHGRRATRGLRPWLLIPKVLGVACYFGGLVAILLLYIHADRGSLGFKAFQRSASVLAFWVLLPGATVAGICGLGLLLQHPRQLLRMRWVRLKLLLLFAVIGPMELAAWYLLQTMKTSHVPGGPPDFGQLGFHLTFLVAMLWLIAFTIAVIVLGRQKPRLGQPVAARSGPRSDEA